jgi:hypothetical protein
VEVEVQVKEALDGDDLDIGAWVCPSCSSCSSSRTSPAAAA